MKLKTLLLFLLLSISLSGVSHASVNKGWEAFDKGDYQTSFKEWETLAETDVRSTTLSLSRWGGLVSQISKTSSSEIIAQVYCCHLRRHA